MRREDSGNPFDNRHFGLGFARAFGGAIIFNLPLLMTMEMWWLGFYTDRLRLALLMVLVIGLLVGLSHYIGFEETFGWKDDLIDSFVAYTVGFVAAAVVLPLLGVIEAGMSANEVVGMIALQAVPGSIGAMLARSQLGSSKAEGSAKRKPDHYGGELFIMAVGSLVLAFNLAPTEEMVQISYMMTEWHMLLLITVSILLMHAFVYAIEFRGESAVPSGTPRWSVFLRYTVVGYALVLLISLYILWTFGRTDGLSLRPIVMTTLVLAFPGAVGAAAARLIL